MRQPCLIHKFIKSLITLGFNDHSNNRSINSSDGSTWNELNVYEDYFENKFLAESTQYYQREFDIFFKSLPTPQYYKYHKWQTQCEISRMRIFPFLTEKKIEDILSMLYIPCNLNIISTENKPLLNKLSGDIEHMIYAVWGGNKGVRETSSDLKPIFEQYFIKKGEEAINKIDATSSINPKVYAETLIGVWNKYSQLILIDSSLKFASLSVLSKACHQFFNYNSITKQQSSHSAKLFAHYCNLLLKKGKINAEEDELNNKLNKFMTCFIFLEEKDDFEDFYCQLLATRLAERSSVSYDTEASMIMKLTKDCDRDYMRKMEQLISDARESDDLNKQYYNQLATSSQLRNVKFRVQVFKSFAWPHSQGSQLILPIEIKGLMESYNEFYQSLHQTKKEN